MRRCRNRRPQARPHWNVIEVIKRWDMFRGDFDAEGSRRR